MNDLVREMGARCSNWGKWGDADERGTLNYISPETVARAATLVRRGAVFSLAVPFDAKGPQTNNHPRRFNPIHRMMLTGGDFSSGAVKLPGGVGFSDDMIIMPTHCGTQWDAISHCFVDGRMYNGYDANEVSSQGARKLGVEKIANGVVTRGVLLDLPRVKNVQWLDASYGVTIADLDAALADAHVAVGKGDALLVRTGHMAMCRARGSWGDYAGGPAPGLAFETADWVHRHELAAVATDTWGMEVQPSQVTGALHPLHQVFLPFMGLIVGEIFDLEALAADCAADGVYEFFFAAPPLPITGGVGSPINPLAIK